MGKGGGQQQVTDYYMSMHQGICAGADALLGIYVGEKTAWEGSQTALSTFNINNQSLFGGNKSEGGVRGDVTWLPGNDDQVLPAKLAGLLGGTPTTVPGFRGVASLFFTGSNTLATNLADVFSGIAARAFYWSSNTPYLKTLWIKVRRAPKGLNPAYRMVGNRVTASISGYTVTCGGVTTTLTPSTTTLVGGHSFNINNSSSLVGARTVIFDGVPIEVAQDDDDVWSVAIDGDSRAVGRWGDTVNIRGVELIVGQTTMGITSGSAVDAPDANPAHIIYECLTNTDWGMGAASSIINVASFEAAGQTLFNEGLGLSLTWMTSDTIENFVSEILDHILATIFVNPSDGLITIKLIRDDYDAATLPELNPDNCTVTSFDRKLWGETTNEIVVTWTNPINESEETVTVQDLANASIQGAVVSDSRNYYGIRNSALALQLATRDLRSASSPLASFELEVDRSAWNFVPGGVVKLVYPEDGINGVVLRIGRIDYGKPGTPTIRISATEDVFGLPTSNYTVVEGSSWEDAAVPPMVMPYTQFLTAPRYFVENSIDITQAEYPDALTLVLAAAESSGVSGYRLFGIKPSPNGQPEASDLGYRSVVGHAELAEAITADYKTTLPSTAIGDYSGPVYTYLNCFVVMGDGGDAGTEIGLISQVTDTGIVVQRGLLDTVPRNWPIGTPLWFFAVDLALTDTTVRADGETPQYKIVTETSLGVLPLDVAPIQTASLTARAWLPNRPANVKVGTVAFGTAWMAGASTIAVSWANRNRLMEPTEVVKWYDGTITPESGQTTKITVMKPDRTVLTTHEGLTGVVFDLPVASLGGELETIVRVTAVRDGLESLQGHEIALSNAVDDPGVEPTPDPDPDPTPGDPWTGITAVASPSGVSGSGSVSIITSGSTTITVTGGSGAYSYSWGISLEGDYGITIVSRYAATTAFRATLPTDSVTSGTAYCTVTDTATGQTTTSNAVLVALNRN